MLCYSRIQMDVNPGESIHTGIEREKQLPTPVLSSWEWASYGQGGVFNSHSRALGQHGVGKCCSDRDLVSIRACRALEAGWASQACLCYGHLLWWTLSLSSADIHHLEFCLSRFSKGAMIETHRRISYSLYRKEERV